MRATLPSPLGSVGARGAFVGRGVRDSVTLRACEEHVLDDTSSGTVDRNPEGETGGPRAEGSRSSKKVLASSRVHRNLEQRCHERDLVEGASEDGAPVLR